MGLRASGASHPGRRWAGSLVAVLLVLAAFVAPAAVSAGTYRDCSAIELEPGGDLHRCDLAGITIIGLDLHGINFARSNLTGTYAGCHPDEPRTNLAGASIYRAILVDALLCDAILTDADLHGSDLSGASLEDATVRDANLSNATWRDGAAIGARFNGADLHRIDLRGTNLRAADLVGTDLRYAQLDGVDFTSADLTGANWKKATGLDSAIFSDTTCPDGSNSDANGGTCPGI